jgi:hypothetical protein
MRRILIAVAAVALLHASARANPLTDDEAIAQDVVHRMNEAIMDECNMASDVKGADFDRVAKERHLSVTLDDCVKASAALAKDAEESK